MPDFRLRSRRCKSIGKHCGFLINAGGATASDVMELIRQIQAKVKEQFGVQLEPEIQFLGEF